MQITLEELLQGKPYKKGNLVFNSTGDIVAPFIEQVYDHVDDWIITVQAPKELAVERVIDTEIDTETLEEYKLYSRVAIEGILKPEYQVSINGNDLHKKTVGMIYALDTNDPVAKVYTGFLRQLCMNQCIFNPSYIESRSFNAPDFNKLYRFPNTWLTQIEEEIAEFEEISSTLHRKVYQGAELKEVLGHLAVQCIARYSGMGTAFNNMIRFISSNRPVGDIQNHYFNKSGEYSKNDLYNCLTATVSSKTEPIARPETIYKCYTLFKNN